MDWGLAEFAAVATIIGTIIGAAAFVRSGNNAAEGRLATSINGVKTDLKEDLTATESRLTANLERVDRNLREHETACQTFRDGTNTRLGQLEGQLKATDQ